MAQFRIRDATDQDIPGIADLFDVVEDMTSLKPEEYASNWRWLHLDNPADMTKVAVGTDDQGRVLAHAGLVPFLYRRGGTIQVAGFQCQLMVLEEYRKELLFLQLQRKLLKEYREAGFHFLFSLVNRPRVLEAYLAFGFQEIGVFPVYAKPFRLRKLAESVIGNKALASALQPFSVLGEWILRRRRTSSGGPISVTEALKFDPEFDPSIADCFSSLGQAGHYHAERNTGTLNWRFSKSPRRGYRILLARENHRTVGYLILRPMPMKQFQVLALVDFLFRPERNDVGAALLQQADWVAEQLGMDLCACLVNPLSPYLPVLKTSGYWKTPETFTLVFHGARSSGAERLNSAPPSLAHWHLTWFDQDFV